MEHALSSVILHTFIAKQLLLPSPVVSSCTRDHDCTLFEAREKRQLHAWQSNRHNQAMKRKEVKIRQPHSHVCTCRVAEDAKNRLRLVDALIAMDSRPVIQAENMVTMSNSEELKMDLNGVITELNDFQLLCPLYFLLVELLDYVDPWWWCRPAKCSLLKSVYMCHDEKLEPN